MRLDLYLFEKGLVRSRTQATELIRDGKVFVLGKERVKNSTEVGEGDEVRILREEKHQYVSRGALKLEYGLGKASIDPSGMVCADIGASTGGFTQVLLLRGAKKVYAVDVGSGQLSPSLLEDPRVINLEKTNARHSLTGPIREKCGLIVSDVSFISQTLIIPNIPEILDVNGCYLFLVKPQFECGPDARDRHGVVRDPSLHLDCVRKLTGVLL
ncbi:MAG: TlyA family RNA methyltransferase, partial [Clostridia bacterium]|nr:TlyA family RNA methyltransferase [Clostridia bacterium]